MINRVSYIEVSTLPLGLGDLLGRRKKKKNKIWEGTYQYFPSGACLTVGRGGDFYSVTSINYLILLSGWPNICQHWWSFHSCLKKNRDPVLRVAAKNISHFLPLADENAWRPLIFPHFSAGDAHPLCTRITGGDWKESSLLKPNSRGTNEPIFFPRVDFRTQMREKPSSQWVGARDSGDKLSVLRN